MWILRKKRKAEGPPSGAASKKSKQETEEEKALRVMRVPVNSVHSHCSRSSCDVIIPPYSSMGDTNFTACLFVSLFVFFVQLWISQWQKKIGA